MKNHRETSKMLLWAVITLSAIFSVVIILLAWFGREDGNFSMTAGAIGTLWSAAVPVVAGCYDNRAKAKDEYELERLRLGISVDQDIPVMPSGEELQAIFQAGLAAQKKKQK